MYNFFLCYKPSHIPLRRSISNMRKAKKITFKLWLTEDSSMETRHGNNEQFRGRRCSDDFGSVRATSLLCLSKRSVTFWRKQNSPKRPIVPPFYFSDTHRMPFKCYSLASTSFWGQEFSFIHPIVCTIVFFLIGHCYSSCFVSTAFLWPT